MAPGTCMKGNVNGGEKNSPLWKAGKLEIIDILTSVGNGVELWVTHLRII